MEGKIRINRVMVVITKECGSRQERERKTKKNA
jgi:hypothetical protein